MRKRLHWTLSVVLAGSLLAAGCGSSGKEASTSKPADSSAATTAEGGNQLHISLDGDPPNLDPAFSTAFMERQVFASLYNKLVDLDKDGKIVPELAESWTVSDDKKSYTFKLHQGVKFQDGTDFNADAVKFNLERDLDKASPRKSELDPVDKVTVVDPYTVKVDLKEPFSPFLSILTDRAGMMVSPAAVKKYGKDFANNPVGTGPFKFKEHVKGDHIEVVKNENYWEKGLPKLDSVVYKSMPDKNVAFMNLKSGQIDITNRFPEREVAGLKNDPKLEVINKVSYAYQCIYLNTMQPPFNVKELREAVDTLIDRDALIKVLKVGIGAGANSPFGPSHFAYGDSDKYQAPNIQKAKELLAKAGKPNGFSFTMTIKTSPFDEQTAVMIQNMLKPAGIDMKIEKLEYGQLLKNETDHKFEALQNQWSGRPDPDQNIQKFIQTGNFNNYPGYSNKKVDELLTAARIESDPAKRKALYDQMMDILHDEVPIVYLYHEADLMGISKAVKGFTYIPDGIIRTANLSK